MGLYIQKGINMTVRRVIDTHVQLGQDHWLSLNQPTQIAGSSGWSHRYDLDEMEQDRVAMRADGFELEAAAVLPFPSAPPEGYRAGNEAVVAWAESSPLRLFPFLALNPFDEPEREWLADLLAAGRPCAGIKLNPFLGRPGGYPLTELADDEELVALIERHGLRVAMHVGTGREHLTRPVFPDVPADPGTALELARRLPDVPMLMLHLLRLSPRALLAARDQDNVFIDSSGLTSVDRISEGGHALLFADEVPTSVKDPATAARWLINDLDLGDRLVFGSATPFASWWGSSAAADAAILREAIDDDAVLEAVLVGNAERLLGPRRDP